MHPSLTNRDHERSVSMELEVRSGQLHHHSTHGHLSLMSLLSGPGLTLSCAKDIPDKQAPVGPHYSRHRLVRPLRPPLDTDTGYFAASHSVFWPVLPDQA